ncbi:MAG: hypothetical protein B7Y88_15540, partial [Sphingomonadales bacterium 32-64-17]
MATLGLGQFAPDQHRLVETALPEAQAMERHRHDEPLAIHRRQARRDQAGEHWRQRDPAAMLE